MKTQNVNGNIDEYNLNIVDAHVHIWTQKKEDEKNCYLPEVNSLPLVEHCLKNFKKCGGNLVIDCTPFECGRDGNKFYEISDKTGVKIISTTGFHRREYYPEESKVWNLSFEEASSFFMDEIKNGLKETINNKNMKAGIIKIPFTGSLNKTYETLTNSAIKAAIETNAPVIVHTEKGLNIEWFSEYLEKNGIKPNKVVFCHIDKRNDIKFHLEIASKGFYLEYDTFLREKYEPIKNTYELIAEMIKSGLGNSIMIGSDIYSNSMWQNVNLDTGYGGFFKKLAQILFMKRGDIEIIRNIMGGNALRFLSL